MAEDRGVVVKGFRLWMKRLNRKSDTMEERPMRKQARMVTRKRDVGAEATGRGRFVIVLERLQVGVCVEEGG